MTLKLLVFGKTGQLARALGERAGPELNIAPLGRAEADLTDPATCAERIARADADIVINAAAWTAVDAAEDDEPTALRVNGEAPGAMARAAAARGLPFLHVSTDYVFDGSGERPWREDDPIAPLGAYGRTKLAGERAVSEAGGPHAILRTAWVFSPWGTNFVRTMLRVGAERDRLTVVGDQRGGPTSAADIADALIAMARAFAAGKGESGLYHFAGAPTVSWADFAEAIMAGGVKRGLLERAPEIARIRTEDWPTKAARPGNSALACGKIERIFGVAQPDWRTSLDTVLARLAAEAA